MSLFDVLPLWSFLALSILGVLAGFGLRLLLYDLRRQSDDPAETRTDRFTRLVGTLSQSAAIGLALALVGDLLLVSRTHDARLLAGLTLVIATSSSFAAAFVREAMRRLFYRED